MILCLEFSENSDLQTWIKTAGKDRSQACFANGGFMVSVQFLKAIRCLKIKVVTFIPEGVDS